MSSQAGQPTSNVDRATAVTEELIDRGAPWSTRTTWQIVLGEAIGTVIIGLILLLAPLGGASTILQVVGIVLLVLALIAAFEIWRKRIPPERTTLAAFRSGSGVTTGLLIIAATFLVGVSPSVTAAMAVVLGTGFIVFGIAGIVINLLHRDEMERLPVAALVANAVLAVVGLVLLFSGAAGGDRVLEVFRWVGILLIVCGLALGGYSYLLYQREASVPPQAPTAQPS